MAELSIDQARAILVLRLQRGGLRPSAAVIKAKEFYTLHPENFLTQDSIEHVATEILGSVSSEMLSPRKSRSAGAINTQRQEPKTVPSLSLTTIATEPSAPTVSSPSKFVPPKRSPRKDPGIWKEVVELDTTIARVAAVTERARALDVATRMRADLDVQVAEREAAKQSERENGRREREALLAKEEASRKADREKAHAKAVAAAEAARKIVDFGLEEKAKKEKALKEKFSQEAAAIKASEELLVKAEKAAALQRAREKEDLKHFMKSNDSVIAARKAKLEEERQAENKAARAAIAAMDAAEERRLADIKAREDALKAKLSAMGDVYAKQAADERELEARLEAERKRGERARDQQEIDREIRRKAFEESIKKEVAIQLSEKESAAAKAKAFDRELRKAADAAAAQVLRDIESERAVKTARAAQYQFDLDLQLQNKLASMAIADETPLEKTAAKTFIKEVKGALEKGKIPLTF